MNTTANCLPRQVIPLFFKSQHMLNVEILRWQSYLFWKSRNLDIYCILQLRDMLYILFFKDQAFSFCTGIKGKQKGKKYQ